MTVEQLINELSDLMLLGKINSDDFVNIRVNEQHNNIDRIHIQMRNDEFSWLYDKNDNPFEYDTGLEKLVTITSKW